jgi:tetratricopeptide (TPR) repeat protein
MTPQPPAPRTPAGPPASATEAEALIRRVAAAAGSGDLPTAFGLAENALSRGLRHPLLYRLHAVRCEREGRLEEAVRAFRGALSGGIGQHDAATLGALGLCLARLGQFEEALAALDHSLLIEPGNASTHYKRGWTLESSGELDLAAAAYRRAVEIDQKHVAAIAGGALIAARRGRWTEARDAADHATALQPGEPTATMALAMAELGEGRAEAAEAIVNGLLSRAQSLPPHVRAVAETLLGDSLDRQRRPAEAFAAWTAANNRFRKLHAGRVEPGRKLVALLTGYFSAVREDGWQRSLPDADSPVTGHVFLVGFPRSGTTLIGQVLASHPDVTTLDEQETLTEPSRELMNSPAGLDRLAALDGPALAHHRSRYWTEVRRLGGLPDGKVFVDKLPMNTLALPLITRLFPSAKILMIHRDPRDVVLGCFRRQFIINPATLEFLDLLDTARYYDAVMSLAEIYRQRLPLDWRVQRYEDLVMDFEGQTRAICDFLGLHWTPDLQGFAQQARRGGVRTVSSEQVTRGLYREGVGQWQAYAQSLAPVLPLLEPWVRRYGYAPE